MLRRFPVTVTADGAGNAEVYSPTVSGKLVSIRYVKPGSGGYTNGVDFVVTSERTSEALWAEDNVNASATRYPRAATHSTAGAASLYAALGTGVLAPIALADDRVKIVISSAVSGVGTFHLTIDG